MASEPKEEHFAAVATLPATPGQRRMALSVLAVSVVVFLALAPFARQPLAPVAAFIPIYQSALAINDLITALLLAAQSSVLRSRALLVLAAGYLFTAVMAVVHLLSFPGLFSPGGLLGAGPQSTAWLYMFWHAGFPLCAIAYAFLKGRPTQSHGRDRWMAIAGVAAAACAFTLLATAGASLLPPIMQGNAYTPAMIFVVSSVWGASLAALVVLWWRRPHSVLDLWLMIVMFAWLFDIALSAVLNAGRFDLGFYAGRVYGLLAASFVLGVLLVENVRLYSRLAETQRNELAGARTSLARHAERLRILHEIDRAMAAERSPEAVAGAVVEALRELLGVPRAIVNRFDLASGEVEWLAAAGRRRTHVGPGVRYSIALMGDLEALRRGEPQLIDVQALPPGKDRDALLASDVQQYMAVPMIAGGELRGAISFGGASGDFTAEQLNIAREVATQLAIALSQAELLGRVRGHAAELEARVRERTAELQASNKALESFSYSVSHDLRAPLRSVDGYARILEEDYAAQLDDEGRRLLSVVRAGARKMNQLIEDLLAFSRLGRKTPAKRPVDMRRLASEVVTEMQAGSSTAAVEIAALPAAHADPALLKQVWVNLIGNALKYSSKRADARVQIGGREENGEYVYWVRDNGVGFDMRYVDKLFGVFQRLHRPEEFDGTGVGLAIVQRLVAGHGGRVWAEAKPGEGACFHFSLPKQA